METRQVHRRRGWLFVAGCALLGMLFGLLLVGCAGTLVEFEGDLCGQPVRFAMRDAKDRSSAEIQVRCGPDGGVTITTAESSTSAVTAAQAQALNDLAGVLAREAAAGVLP